MRGEGQCDSFKSCMDFVCPPCAGLLMRTENWMFCATVLVVGGWGRGSILQHMSRRRSQDLAASLAAVCLDWVFSLEFQCVAFFPTFYSGWFIPTDWSVMAEGENIVVCCNHCDSFHAVNMFLVLPSEVSSGCFTSSLQNKTDSSFSKQSWLWSFISNIAFLIVFFIMYMLCDIQLTQFNVTISDFFTCFTSKLCYKSE